MRKMPPLPEISAKGAAESGLFHKITMKIDFSIGVGKFPHMQAKNLAIALNSYFWQALSLQKNNQLIPRNLFPDFSLAPCPWPQICAKMKVN
jgi:hypothetical protein